jgi:PhnB protein
MAKAANPIPAGLRTVTPHITVNGAARFSEFLTRAFNGVELRRAEGPGGGLMHAEMRIGDSVIIFNDDFPAFHKTPLVSEGRLPVAFQIYVPDADATYAQAVAAGCQATMPLSDMFWGDRYGQVKDPFGFTWAIATRKEDLTQEEMAERQKAFFSAGA